jgi:hypothetical protein
MKQKNKQHRTDLKLGHDAGDGVAVGGLENGLLELGGLGEVLGLHHLLQLELRVRRE